MSIINHFLKTINTESEDTKLFPNEFMYKKTTMDNYRFFTDYARRDIIYATCDNIKQRNDVSEWVHCSDTQLLQSMLVLREKLGFEFFEDLQKNNYLIKTGVIKEFVYHSITKWCEDFGYPFPLVEYNCVNNAKFPQLQNIELPTCDKFNVYDFLYELDEIYGAFLLVQKILTKNYTEIKENGQVGISIPEATARLENDLKTTDYDEIQKCIDLYIRRNEQSEASFDTAGIDHIVQTIKKQMNHSSRNLLARDLRITYKKLEEIEPDACIKIFLQKFQERHYAYKFNYAGGIYLDFYTDNLFDAAFYQLAQMLVLPGRQVRLCPICRTFFVPTHGNQKYCGTKNSEGKHTCYPEKLYKRKNYIRKKRTSE